MRAAQAAVQEMNSKIVEFTEAEKQELLREDSDEDQDEWSDCSEDDDDDDGSYGDSLGLAMGQTFRPSGTMSARDLVSQGRPIMDMFASIHAMQSSESS